HELRNPLAPIRNAVEVMRGAALPDSSLRQAREIVDRQVRQLARLVDDLLDVSRIRRGVMELRREWLDLTAVLGGAVESSRPLIEGRGHRLSITAPPGPLWLEADPVRLEQVIANLLNNAAKYTAPGGRIWLELALLGPQVVLTVRDTGIGFPHGVESRFFEPFVQGELPADAQGGLGIGLALVRGLVELHGGEVAARSPGPGLGSEFVVRLPLPELAAPPVLPREAEEADSAPERPLAVLIVEDDRDTAHSLATLVEIWGHRPRTAADGIAGLAAAAAPAEPPPDVALLDLGLPGMDGCDLARALRGRLGPDLLLVALTGYGQEEDRRRTREAGFDHHFVKPIAPQTLRHLLADWSKQRPR
ncbi:MAG TPA: hybrid sensor histidine kinase/response regulator, partial [Thermoanaerobaculia bacterium]|nr:hybrid sensor histidine kinase/response regulator [Thermoanaerobaculia bacterium]